MNNMILLLKQLERQGVKLALNDKGQLISQSSKEAVTPAIGATIKAHKDELVRCLAARAAFPYRTLSGAELVGWVGNAEPFSDGDPQASPVPRRGTWFS